jgi:O-antigen/teichoic acid export membrane protein
MTFAGRVAGVLGTRLVQLVSTLVVSFLLARILGPDGRGVYAVVVLVPTTLFAFSQLGLGSALTFHAGGDGSVRDLERHGVILGGAISCLVAGATLLALPALEPNVLRTAPDDLLRIALVALPLRVVATFAGNILYGRHRFRAYNLILAIQSVLGVVLVIVLVGWLGLGVPGAVAAYLLFVAFGTVAVLAELDRHRRSSERRTAAGASGDAGREAPGRVSVRDLAGFGLRLYPSTVATFLGYRADVFLLGWLLGSASEIGIYAVAVSLAELVFNVPDSVGTVLFPRIASVTRDEADRLAPAMSRMTTLVTAGAGLALVPVAWVALAILLPAFVPGIVPLIVILPGIVSLSIAKVLTSYLAGIERLGAVTWAAVAALVANVIANLVLIPRWGINGAAAASLFSYTLYACLMVVAASRASRAPALAFVLPHREDATRLLAAASRLGVLRLRRRGA